jgi:Epoxide hydrolase N terminus
MKKPFKINIEQSILDDLKTRIANTRWTYEIENSKWEYGTNKSYLKELCEFWQNEFDWKKQEEYPIVLGKGKPLFKNLKDKHKMKLINTKTFNSGLVQLIYQPQMQ